ncbi:MAG TPA: glycosyltransferase 61 family protein [Burkholderiaceae bacterium]|nr:glycosyltransferase 61 family protein [Burkholderiaceae bacterium]
MFDRPRPRVTHASNLLYTRLGMAWQSGTLQRRYSFQEVGPRHILERPRGAARTFARASILQSQTPLTYGDWVSEHVAALSVAIVERRLVEPLLLPQWWFSKSYVQRDLGLMGIRAEGFDATVRIEDATVIHKTRHSHFWARSEVEAIVAAMKIVRRPCAPGSALYLSRKGERGEGAARQVNNDVAEAAMTESGVQVVRTAGLTREDYIDLATSAETVFFDHGSAVYNMLHWQTRRVVELYAPTYWDPSFLLLADCLGIHDYHVWQCGPDASREALVSRVAALRAEAFVEHRSP